MLRPLHQDQRRYVPTFRRAFGNLRNQAAALHMLHDTIPIRINIACVLIIRHGREFRVDCGHKRRRQITLINGLLCREGVHDFTRGPNEFQLGDRIRLEGGGRVTEPPIRGTGVDYRPPCFSRRSVALIQMNCIKGGQPLAYMLSLREV